MTCTQVLLPMCCASPHSMCPFPLGCMHAGEVESQLSYGGFRVSFGAELLRLKLFIK